MYTITKEQLQEAVQNPETLKSLFPDAFELEVGKWYRFEFSMGLVLVVMITGKNLGQVHHYGFNKGLWNGNDWSAVSALKRSKYREATHEEVTEALERELVRRYGEDWENVKIKKCLFDVGECTNEDIFTPVININRNKIWNRNGCIFKDGVWAEKLEDVKPKKELEIKEGERYICRKDVVLDSGEILFVRGKVYSSNCDYNLINEREFNNYIDASHAYKHFLKLPQ